MAVHPSLLFVNQQDWPDVASTGQHLSDLVEHLARAGHDVRVLTGRIHEIPVWNDPDEVLPIPRDRNPLRRELGLDGAFVVMNSGNAGLAHRFDDVCRAMARLDGEDGVEFVFVGGEPRTGEIRPFVRERCCRRWGRLLRERIGARG